MTINSKLNEEKGGGSGANQSKKKPEEDNNLKEFSDELSAYKKWLRNRNWVANVEEFNANILTKEVMYEIYNNYWKGKETVLEFDEL